MDIIRLPEAKATFWDRLHNAYYAFKMQVKPDLQAVFDQLDAIHEQADAKQQTLEDKRTAALDKLDPFTQSQIHSVAGATEMWREQFEQAMLFVDTYLSIEDQLAIMQYIFAGNRRVTTQLRFQQWMTKHAEAILDHLEK